MEDSPEKLTKLLDLLGTLHDRGDRIQTLKFHFAVESPQGISAMALAVILDEALSGAPPEQVARVSGEIVYDIFGRELSMGKNIGLISMVSMVTNSAKRYLSTRAPVFPRA